MVDVRVAGDLDVEQRARPVLALVADAARSRRWARARPSRRPPAAASCAATPPRPSPVAAVEVDDVADAELVLGEDEQPRQEVLDERLRPEAERDADDARARQQRRDVDAELAQHHEAREQRGSRSRDAAQDARQRADALLGAQARRGRLSSSAARRAPAHGAQPLAHDAAGAGCAAPRSMTRPTSALTTSAPIDDQHDRQRRAEDEVGDLGERAVLRAVEDLPAERVGVADRTCPAARSQRCLRNTTRARDPPTLSQHVRRLVNEPI